AAQCFARRALVTPLRVYLGSHTARYHLSQLLETAHGREPPRQAECLARGSLRVRRGSATELGGHSPGGLTWRVNSGRRALARRVPRKAAPGLRRLEQRAVLLRQP